MLKESSNNQNQKIYSETSNKKENIICKDGFCTLPNQEQISKQTKNDTNLFDPIK